MRVSKASAVKKRYAERYFSSITISKSNEKMSSATSTSQTSTSVPAGTPVFAGETVYSNLSKAEFDAKIVEVQTETQKHVEELIKESEDLEASQVLEMLHGASDSFSRAKSMLAEVQRRKSLRKEDRPGFSAGVAEAVLKLS